MAKTIKKKSKKSEPTWIAIYGFFGLLVALGFFMSMNYYFEKAEYNQQIIEYGASIEFYTVADVLNSNYSHSVEAPERPGNPVHYFGLMVMGVVGFFATKYVKDFKR